jgi:serine phosphatase RsbU (regulator of sigma subunit)/anti-sigma regulatory factor (Ser/Thr protein kinase)
MHVGALTERHFDAADQRLLELAADRVAMALEHSRLLHEHHLAVTLQESLLPERLPEVAGLTFAARYLPGQGASVGGDWYDVVPLPSGGVALVMGDVVSHGIRAASVMAQLRNALRTYAMDGASPVEVVERLAGVVRALDRREMVTLAYLVVDPEANEVRYVLGGHPPPLVVDGDGSRFLEEPRSPPLGALAHPRYVEGSATLAPDSVLVLYTDGLVERRGAKIDDGIAGLVDVVADGTQRDPDMICDAALEQLLPGGEADDDVALLVTRTVAQRSDVLDLRLPAIASSLAVLRRALRTWLPQNGANDDDVIEVLIAVGEAAGNAVEHAYGPGDALFDVSGSVTDGVFEIAVRDYGSWRPPRGQNRGRGTLLMQQLMDEFEVSTTNDGTEVRLVRRLGLDRRS